MHGEMIGDWDGLDTLLMSHYPPEAGEVETLTSKRQEGASIDRLYGHVHDKVPADLPKWCICVCA